MLGIHKGSGKADHRMQLCMCCTANHRRETSGSPHLGLNMPTPCFSPQSESALTRNDYSFECHMRQGPLSHAKKNYLLWNFCWQVKEEHKHLWAQCIPNMHVEILLWVESTKWGDIYAQANAALMTHESDWSTTMFTKLCPWVINQFLLWVLITGIQLDLMTAGLHETISLVFW